jgi:SNF2 family DNA or RNA helicase
MILKEIFFSRQTFQGICQEGEEEYYPLIQLSEDNQLQNAICSCSQEVAVCSHAELLHERVLTAGGSNLSEDFEKSFVKSFYMHLFSLHEDDAIEIEASDEALKVVLQDDVLIIKATSEEVSDIEKILSSTEIKDETNSLEFSSLPENERRLYEANRPSFDFRYRLSVYNDIAKYMFLKAPSKRPVVKIEHLEGMKWKLSMNCDGLHLEAKCCSKLMEELVVDLTPQITKTPLHQGSIDIKLELFFDAKTGDLRIEKKPQHILEEHRCQLDKYVYVKGYGFYPKHLDPLFQGHKIDDIAQFFNRYKAHISQLLTSVELVEHKQKAHYDLKMQPSGNLMLTLDFAGSYKVDLHRDHFFNPYILIDKKYLIELEDVFFDEMVKVISKDHLKTFLTRHRAFLKQYPGFEWHMASVQENLDYVFDGKTLEFIKKASDEKEQDFLDCGEFIFVEGSGFYPKVSLEGGSKIVSGLIVKEPNLESFIHENRADLALIKGFFAPSTPLDNVLLSIELSDKGALVTNPIMILKQGLRSHEVVWLGSYTYTKGQGFKEVPSDLKIPVLFAHKSRFGLHELFGLLDLLQTSLKDRMQIDPRLKIPETLKFEIEEISHEKPYMAQGYYCSDLGKCPISFIKKAYEKGERSLCTDAGLLDLTEERFGFLKHLTLVKDGSFSLDPMSFYKLGLYEEVSFAKSLDQHPFILALNLHDENLPLDLTGYTSSLRPYQETGVKWLQNLFRLGLSGMLCDEMGLGKTHQAIAFVAVMANQKMHLKTLVVCPTSVLYHWEKQLKNYLPHQKVHLFHGQTRSFDPKEFQQGILLTSYGVLRSDIEMLSEIPFDLAVYDELQIAKNPHSKVYAALSKIQTLMKIGLSGTPIENTIEDLKALLDLLLPKLLPKASEFKEKFLIPIEKNYDKKARLRLNRVTAPFIMRRLKKDVLKDLPDKVETDMLCEMSPQQELIYHKIVSEQKSSLLNMLSEEKEGTLHVFALLTKLKQLCDHPSLIEPGLDPFKEDMSGKWDLFKELLQEARDSGQKVVVFSQYLEMLNIIETYLKKSGIGFASLRGSSMDRAEQVKRFQEDPKCEVFVGSLLASGVGIDLTAASVVIHYDRWWNPAKEAQATDRVHRIGQNRGVQVFKLITKDTIEERIDWLIKDKLRLADTLSTEEGPDLFKNFTKKELLALVESLT